ncbi:MAG: tRNA (guanosine(37)-N1)-methyltransferase TrmD [Verrucomicrobiae bacterium]|nr:tRNA (guanosine(37)-N1)-methyltransferase TrmD [Verrucomicrobiae bacterium]
MEIDVLTLFPRIFEGPLEESILKRARQSGLVQIRVHNLRDFAHDKHRTVDDRPYGGGPGMLMKPEPIFEAVETLRRQESCVVLMTPQGTLFTQQRARQFARKPHLIIICGHYEGVDERVRVALVDEEVSIGDYVLTNGALAAAVFVDAVVRLVPGVLGHEQGAEDDSFSSGLLEAPQYTRPVEFRGMRVPDVLLSGDHAAIARWRAEQALLRTRQRRPDLLSDKGETP